MGKLNFIKINLKSKLIQWVKIWAKNTKFNYLEAGNVYNGIKFTMPWAVETKNHIKLKEFSRNKLSWTEFNREYRL